MKEFAVISGIQGQDGRLLSAILQSRGKQVIGISRENAFLCSANELDRLVPGNNPCDFYHLAAEHQSSENKHTLNPEESFQTSLETHVHMTLKALDWARQRTGPTRLLYASTSRVFGMPSHSPQSEQTPINPTCIYGITKAAGMMACRFYREKYALPVSVAILFNHESPLRGSSFVSQKIAHAAARIAKGRHEPLSLHSLSAVVDWSAAEDVVEAMRLIVEKAEPGEYVISSGRGHTVREFAEIAFARVGLNWSEHVVEENPQIDPPAISMVGDPARLKAATGWTPSISFSEMVQGLVDHAVNASQDPSHTG